MVFCGGGLSESGERELAAGTYGECAEWNAVDHHRLSLGSVFLAVGELSAELRNLAGWMNEQASARAGKTGPRIDPATGIVVRE